MNWCAGCLGGDDYKEGIAEAVDVQAMNTRTKNTKTYHLVISFRPEDEAKLTPEAFKDIEERFAVALNLSEHQRHCGIHKNTANLHMHVAYNLIHPEKLTMREPFRDYAARDKACRELEQKYSLVIDKGRGSAAQERQRGNDKAATVEAHTGQQSFDTYARERREPILSALEAARTWQDVHKIMAAQGMEIKPHGRGLAIKDMHSDRSSHAIKASALDRTLSQKSLESRFGQYKAPRALENVKEQSRYEAAPLGRPLERKALYEEYRAGIAIRQGVKEKEAAALAAIKDKWKAERQRIDRLALAKRQRRELANLSRKHEAEALAKAKIGFLEGREAMRREVPYTSWNAFLQHKAGQGDETALAALRSRNAEVAVEKDVAGPGKKDWSEHGKEQFQAEQLKIAAKYAEKEREAMTSSKLNQKGKKDVLAIFKMKRLAEEERLRMKQAGKSDAPAIIDGFKSRIDNRGTIIFTLPGGGTIRDTGKELFFSARDEAAQEAAKLYAQAKWGKNIRLDGNLITLAQRERGKGVQR